MIVNGSTIITANLTFVSLGLEHQNMYVCQVVGPVAASTNVRVVVQSGNQKYFILLLLNFLFLQLLL